jgi:hypothetical protein
MYPWIIITLGLIFLIIYRVFPKKQDAHPCSSVLSERKDVKYSSSVGSQSQSQKTEKPKKQPPLSQYDFIELFNMLNKRIMEIVVSLLLLISALYIILFGQHDNESEKWAFSIIGVIVGFWLRSKD